VTAQLEAIAPRVPAPTRIGQGTAVEQSRAVAEVEAQIVVAMRYPRNEPGAIAAMRETCRRKDLAERAFFRYPRAGKPVSGPSIQLARELARIWGNISYGSAELRRDDEYGQSEMLAYAWDVQTNCRNSATIINPHKQYAGGGDLTELRDIQENNASVVNRRVREAIWAVLPAWFVEEAKDICAKTIADGGGIPLAQRIANAIEVFGNLGITIPQLETKIGAPSPKWTDHDVAQLRIIRQSLLRGEISRDEEFPPERSSAAEILQSAQPAPADPGTAPADASGTEHNHAEGSCPPDCPYRQRIVQSAIDHNLALEQPDPTVPTAETPDADSARTGTADDRPVPDPSTSGQRSMIEKQFKRLDFGQDDESRQLATASVLAGRRAGIASLADLSGDEALRVRDALKTCRDDGALMALLVKLGEAAKRAEKQEQGGAQQ